MFQPIKKVSVGIAALAALSLGASAIAGAATSSSSSPPSALPQTTAPEHHFNGPASGTSAHENAEPVITGAEAARALAAAEKAAGGGVIGTVTRNFTHDGYEVLVKKSDGSTVDVHVDSQFTAEVRGNGGPDGHGPEDTAVRGLVH